ncbi:PH domain-containing protein [Paenibacillus sp. GCM10027627]|uniref:PH domain-containing protein n=1 Tax=unclassified Paenibacillus TaxID=185978 RepID=UPI00363CDDE7
MGEILDGKIEKNVLIVWRLTALLIVSPSILIAAAMLLFSLWLHWPFWLFGAALGFVLLVHVLFVVVNPLLRYNRWSYCVKEQAVELRHGIWSRKRTIIPMVRVQHVSMNQGPLMRRYGLASITISTAAGSHNIPGLTERTADEVQSRIAVWAEVSNEGE